jgi:hypothetical protein
MPADPEPGQVWHEIELAERFRREGNEGRARVCARRAAGWAIRPTFRQATGQTPPGDVVALLRWYRDLPEAPTDLRFAAGRLAVAVTTDHKLPHEEDPLEDARHLVRSLTSSTSRNDLMPTSPPDPLSTDSNHGHE